MQRRQPRAGLFDRPARRLPRPRPFRPSRVPAAALREAGSPGHHRRRHARASLRSLEDGSLPHFAFVGWFRTTCWCEEKRRAFAQAIGLHGRGVSEFAPRASDERDPVACRRRLAAWLAAVPKPCGLFAVNDVMAENVLAEIIRVRLEAAQRLLADPRVTVSAVANRCGWNSPALFRRHYGKAFGHTPLQPDIQGTIRGRDCLNRVER